MVLYLTEFWLYWPVDIQIFQNGRDNLLICESAHVLMLDQIFIDFLLIDFTFKSLLPWRGFIQRVNGNFLRTNLQLGPISLPATV